MTNEVKMIVKEIQNNEFTSSDEEIEYMKILFKDYQKRKKENSLYTPDEYIPEIIIAAYFSYVDRLDLNEVYTNFKRRYIYNENKLEGIHNNDEWRGLGPAYNCMNSINFDNLNLYTAIITIHKALYSKTEHPEFGGTIRNEQVFLPGTGIELCPYEYIFEELNKQSIVFSELVKEGNKIANTTDVIDIFKYINKCLRFKCELVKIHPFKDGNGRTIRILINLLFKNADIPPVYIKANERTEYHQAMNKANADNEYSDKNKYDSLYKFYYYKICDSIIELDLEKEKKSSKTI